MMSPLVKDAVSIAIEAHGSTTRKFSTHLYVTHPIAVMMFMDARLSLYTSISGQFRQIILAAAVLHDVVEDTTVSAGELRRKLAWHGAGHQVVDIVEELSEAKYSSAGERLPWEQRKAEHMARIRTASNEAILIKQADCLDNLQDTLEQARVDPESVNKFRGTTLQQRAYRMDIADLANGKIAFSRYRDLSKSFQDSIVSCQAFLDVEMANYRGSK